MSEVIKEDIISEIKALLKNLDLKESDFEKKEKKPGLKAPAHDKIVEKIRDYWDEKYAYEERFPSYGIDFVGRNDSEGHILLAVQVDERSWRGYASCVNLADVRCLSKVWVHVSNKEDAKQDFEYALKQIRKLLRKRRENKEIFGNFVAFLKTPNPKDFKMKRMF